MTTAEQIMALVQALGDLRVMAARGQCVTSDEVGDAHKALQSAVEELEAQLELERKQLEHERIRLAGCGVAAMQNTEASKADRVKPGDYGYSASYGDVCNAVDREIELRTRVQELEAQLAEAKAAMNPDWDVKSACMESVREHQKIAAGLREQLAELPDAWLKEVIAERDALQSRLAELCSQFETRADYVGQLEAQLARMGEALTGANKVIQQLAQSGDEAHKRLAEMEAQEPVAWMRKDGDMIRAHEKRPDYAYTHYYDKPLYAAPVAAPVVTQQLTTCKDCNGSGEIETGIGMMVCDTCGGHPVAAQAKASDSINVRDGYPYSEYD